MKKTILAIALAALAGSAAAVDLTAWTGAGATQSNSSTNVNGSTTSQSAFLGVTGGEADYAAVSGNDSYVAMDDTGAVSGSHSYGGAYYTNQNGSLGFASTQQAGSFDATGTGAAATAFNAVGWSLHP